MGPTAVNAFSEVSHAAPFVIGAYAVIWIALAVFIGMVWRRLGAIEREVRALDEAVSRRGADAS